MSGDRIEGGARELGGKVKGAAGGLVGDAKPRRRASSTRSPGKSSKATAPRKTRPATWLRPWAARFVSIRSPRS